MSPHEKLPSDLSSEKIIRALKRLGFSENKKGGKGSHTKLTWTNEKMIIVQRKMYKSAILGLLNELEEKFGITWQQIKDEL